MKALKPSPPTLGKKRGTLQIPVLAGLRGEMCENAVGNHKVPALPCIELIQPVTYEAWRASRNERKTVERAGCCTAEVEAGGVMWEDAGVHYH